MWWTLLANLLQKNNADAQAGNAAAGQRQQDRTANIMQGRAQAQQAQNQNVSKNYGNIDMNSLISGVFTAKTPNGGMNWGQNA
jgi:hypothetical protein